jgi:hypothetical protein
MKKSDNVSQKGITLFNILKRNFLKDRKQLLQMLNSKFWK